VPLSNYTKHHAPLPTRFVWVGVGFMVLWLVLVLRLWQLQILRGGYYTELAENNHLRSVDIPAPRGKIYDRHGALMLGNRPFYDLVLVPQYATDIPRTLAKLAEILHIPESLLQKQYAAQSKGHPKFMPIVLKKNLSLHEVSLVQTMNSLLPSISVQTDVRRDYSLSPPPHLVGYLSPIKSQEFQQYTRDYPQLLYRRNDLVGHYGLEQRWEQVLRGRRGKMWIHVDALGQRVERKQAHNSQLPPPPPRTAISGNHLTLTIDKELQRVTEQAFLGKNGAVVVINARSGEILAMVSSPLYPADLYQSHISQRLWQSFLNHPMHPLLDKTSGAEFQPGSTYKVILALAGLQEAIIDENSTVHCRGSWTIGNRTFHCHKKEGHGLVNLHQAIAQSCNVYFYELGKALGAEKIAQYSKYFHLGQRLGLALNTEKAGLIPTPAWKKQTLSQPWYAGETALSAIGQGSVLLTPLQLASLYGTISQGGKLWKPYVVQKVVDRFGEILHQKQPQLLRNITTIDPRHFITIQKSLQGVVHSSLGTGRAARVLETTVAGKTGSVQVAYLQRSSDEEALYSQMDTALDKREHALFAAFSPAKNAEIALAVISQHDHYGGGGSQAAPVAKKIISAYYRLKHDRAQRLATLSPQVEEQQP